MRTFAVSSVLPSTESCWATTLERELEDRIGAGVEASGANQADLVRAYEPHQPDDGDDGLLSEKWPEDIAHPLVGAVHLAFASHHPLTLAPDDVWLCLAQGLALHVEANAEALRSRLVRHEGKRTLEVRRDDFIKGSPTNDWPSCFAEFSDQIAEHIGKKRDLIVADFSTTGPVERVASEIVLMSTMSSYFDFLVTTLCGIPSITLLGTVEDWRSVRRRAEVLAELDLEQWVAALLPVLDQFVAAAAGDVDRGFWTSIYKQAEGSGGPYINGWINVLFPYLCDQGLPEEASQRPRPNPFATAWGDKGSFGDGTTLASFPSGLSKAPFVWNYMDEMIPMAFWGGFVGISQDRQTGALRPAIGWAVQDPRPG